MKLEYELVHIDENRSFRLLHHTLNSTEYSWQYHYHPEIELACIPRGNGTRNIGTNSGKYIDGDVILIGSNLPHSGFGLNSEAEHEEIVVQLKEEIFTKHLFAIPEISPIFNLLEKAKYGIHFFGEAKKEATIRLSSISKLSKMEGLLELLRVFNLLAMSNEYELLNDNVLITSSLHKKNIRLQNIFSYLETHFSEEITIQKIASLANLSVPAFCNYFKKKIGITFTDFLNQYRIQHACMLLQDEKTIAEVCFECGFNNVAYFNKVFKNVLKKTPSEFKKDRLAIV